jgi:hypothetical protein
LSFGVRTARLQNARRGLREQWGDFPSEMAENRFVSLLATGSKTAFVFTAARQNHPPIGEKPSNHSRNRTPLLEIVPQEREKVVFARHSAKFGSAHRNCTSR